MIGFFDSGFGGLHVLRGITKRLPGYDYIYLGDSARAPYGPRSSEEVYAYTKQGVEFLFAHGAELVVLACNTASSEALRKIQQEYLREGSPKKVLGVLIPFAEAAAARTKNKRVGVMATEGTVRSDAFKREITKADSTIQVSQQACPLLVPLVEAGEQDSARADELIRGYVAPLLEKNIDTLVLGCTHYGILEGKIRAAVGPDIKIISEEDVMPDGLASYLNRHPEVEQRVEKKGTVRFYCTGDTKAFNTLGTVFFEKAVEAEQVTLGAQAV
ncbi:glutamate racemase [Candidatus Kaiserbacteria bacterium]|nr:glutamate racemase [Candidatus Kaiserbacteria bacterium]